jgi:hypothetical protein
MPIRPKTTASPFADSETVQCVCSFASDEPSLGTQILKGTHLRGGHPIVKRHWYHFERASVVAEAEAAQHDVTTSEI